MPRPDLILLRGFEAVRFLRQGPISTGDLAHSLGVSRDTVNRMLSAIRRSGLPLATERRGRRALHSLPAETLAGPAGGLDTGDTACY